MNKYQIFNDLDDDTYEKLKQSIIEKGVLVPIEYDEEENILDGHHRVKICNELGIKTWPRFIREGLTEEEKRNHARTLNLARRHLTKDERKDQWVAMRKDGMPLEAIAKADGTVDEITVRRALNSVPTNVETQFPEKVTGKDGKQYPTKKKPRTKFISQEAAQKAESLPEQHKTAVLSGAKKPMEAARDAKLDEIAKTVNLPNAKYRVVYADPPWSYGNTQPDYQTDPRDYYPTMLLKEICSLEIKEICLDDAVLFLWVTSPILEESFEVIKAWGFKYKTSFVWDKVKHNMGHYNSVRHEFLLICTRGSCQPDVRKLFDSVVTVERTEHSKKPDVFYEIIETLYPNGKRIELFARQKKDGWDAYGHQA